MTPEPLWEITYEFDGTTAILPQSAVEMMLRGDVPCPPCRARLIHVPLRLRLRRLLRLARERLTEWVERI